MIAEDCRLTGDECAKLHKCYFDADLRISLRLRGVKVTFTKAVWWLVNRTVEIKSKRYIKSHILCFVMKAVFLLVLFQSCYIVSLQCIIVHLRWILIIYFRDALKLKD